MFTQSCFIRKNTPKLRKNLEEFGYKYGGSDTKSWGSSALYCFDGKYYEVYPAKPSRYHWIEDCETNEVLFLSLATLRDDTDANQWFICDKEYPTGRRSTCRNYNPTTQSTTPSPCKCGLRIN